MACMQLGLTNFIMSVIQFSCHICCGGNILAVLCNRVILTNWNEKAELSQLDRDMYCDKTATENDIFIVYVYNNVVLSKSAL